MSSRSTEKQTSAISWFLNQTSEPECRPAHRIFGQRRLLLDFAQMRSSVDQREGATISLFATHDSWFVPMLCSSSCEFERICIRARDGGDADRAWSAAPAASRLWLCGCVGPARCALLCSSVLCPVAVGWSDHHTESRAERGTKAEPDRSGWLAKGSSRRSE